MSFKITPGLASNYIYSLKTFALTIGSLDLVDATNDPNLVSILAVLCPVVHVH